ncbi:UDP-N-acetylmuramoyl-L-alanyl-D-glutamate--2,6-diaminopimelate ligase [Desulfobacterales bacterium HSG2]|nr:UDP-N-acetylmuramoyl-L-alanyl-D-glutamate--2,6-diaminopimelate ligase [Desulfobacterales bacterium HSG2]
MKKLSEFVSLLSPDDLICFQDVPVNGIACRPEELRRENTLYCVIDEFLQYGHWVRGSELLESLTAEAEGASMQLVSALLLERPIPEICLPQVIVPDARQAMACAAKHFFDSPDEQIKIIGVTGTNGKTTTTHLINRMLTACGERSAALGTLGLYIGPEKYAETVYTTSLSPTLFETLNELRGMGIKALAMEISSHALKLDRAFGLDIDVAVFTNLTRDHLDFHGSMEDYRASKIKLFTTLKPGAAVVVNSDDATGREIITLSHCTVTEYGRSPGTNLKAGQIECSPKGTAFQVCCQDRTLRISTSLVGDFNVSNMLAALGACLALGIDPDALQEAASCLSGVAGRIEAVPLPGDRTGIVDYAHTPDSLEKVLHALRATGAGRIITVFGCGGDRDKGKRPLMGEVAAHLSDLCVVTSDNPRREDPDAIIEDILAGMPAQGVVVEPNRREAIRKAHEMSREGDIILVAGKGHEPYQIIGDEEFPFDDREELRNL